MSNQFAEYVRSGAFRLELSERMIHVLLAMTGKGCEDDRLNLHPYQALERRGLVSRESGKMEVTEAGRHVAEILILAGYGDKEASERAAS